MFDDAAEARAASEPIPGPATEAIVGACRETGSLAVIGMLESAGDVLYNSAVLCGPEGVIGVYRKTHLPFLGVDRLTRLGPGPYEVFDTPIGRIGMLICYDLRFPEATRCLTLAGADILVLPTNWPEGAEASPNYTAQRVQWRTGFLSSRSTGREWSAVPDSSAKARSLIRLGDGWPWPRRLERR